eukprot:TRINITY_DN11677_c0_g1_i1.p1 TRINITY_DN11677_c0_g1~~TRINITY_DN11677_c0_g1_i1.p1  ORF type:complete len:239 (-),score=72.48 TRINITY_DN11677_c0_g1_i1:97-753(-)
MEAEDEQQLVKPMADQQHCRGEIAIGPCMLGSSWKLLNADHEKVYFMGMPSHKGQILRRHGDEFERTLGGFFIAHGRCDDTMNLGGIKVSSIEIERICNSSHSSLLETAAIGVEPAGGGPQQLVLVVVLKVEVREAKQQHQEKQKQELMVAFSSALQKNLNPLFKVSQVVFAPSLPRNATNKILRRVLRNSLFHLGNVSAADEEKETVKKEKLSRSRL